MSLSIRCLDGQHSRSTKVWRKDMANRQQPALVRCSGIVVPLSILAVSLVLITGCDRAGQKEETGSWFSGSRVDTITVKDTITLRDTIVVVDTIWVEKEVIKKVEVPAKVPMLYQNAWKRFLDESIAKFADEKTCFAGLDSMYVSIALDEDIEDILSEQRAQDKVELTLRRHGLPLLSNPPSHHLHPSISDLSILILAVDAFWNESKTLATYTISVSLNEPLIFYRNKKPHRRYVILWESSSYGQVGKNLAKETFIEAIEEKAERVANLYLSAN